MEVIVHRLAPLPYAAGEKLEVTVNHVDSAFANGLRRVMLAEIPTLAIERVTVKANTSCYNDELLAHRMGLVPLLSERASTLCFPFECHCGARGCVKCSIDGELRVRCEAHRTSKRVTSQDLVFFGQDDAPLDANADGGAAHSAGAASSSSTSLRAVQPVSSEKEGVWLLTLGRGQEIDIAFKVQKGIAKMHAKYMATATVAMQYSMDIRVNGAGLADLSDGTRRTWVERCPTKVFAMDSATGQVFVENADACMFCRECLTIEAPFNDLPAPLVAVKPKKDRQGKYSVMFKIESTGAIGALQILQQANGILRKKLDTVTRELDEEHRKATGGGGGGAAGPTFGGGQPPPATRKIGSAPTAFEIPNADYVPLDAGDEDHIGGRTTL